MDSLPKVIVSGETQENMRREVKTRLAALVVPTTRELWAGRPILALAHNGDPYGSGFTASESTDGGRSWVYRGDIGARPRSFWRRYARKGRYILREV